MQLFDKLKQSLSNRHRTAEQQYVDLLRRADNPQPGDEDQLEQLAQTLGITLEQATAEAEVLKSIDSLQSEADTRSDREAARGQAARALRSYDAETETIVKERQQKHSELEAVERRATGMWSHANEAASKINALIYANPRLFADQIKSRIRNGEERYGSPNYWRDAKAQYPGTFSDVQVEVEYHPQGQGTGPVDPATNQVIKEWKVSVSD